MTSKAQQIKLDNALVPLENYHVIGKCNMRINPGMKPKEPTYQVVLDALALTTCYPTFLIITESRSSICINSGLPSPNTKHHIHSRSTTRTLTEKEAILFIRELGHSREIKYITNVIVDHLHHTWRTFASIINKCLCGKVSSLDKIQLSRVHILWGMYYKKNLDFVALNWEDLAYQIDNIDSKKQNKIHADTRVYGAILPKAMTNSALLDTIAYKTYYAIASGAKSPKSRKSQKKSDSAISSEESPSKKKFAKSNKVTTTKPKPTKKNASVKADTCKGLNVILEVALTEATQLKEATKRSKKEFHDSHASGSGDGTDFELGVPDEQHHKTSGADEGTEEHDNDEDDTKCIDDYDDDDNDDNYDNDGDDDDNDANDDDNQEDDDKNDDEEKTDSDRTESDKIKIPDLNQSSIEYYEEGEEKVDDEEKMNEEDDEVTKELYKDVNVNLGNKDVDMTDADQGGTSQQNISQETWFEQETLIVTNLEKYLSEIKQVDQYAQALSFILAIVDRYIEKKLREAIQKAILAHNLDYREEAQVEKRDYIELVDTSIRAILKEEVNTQLLQILPQAVPDFATPVIEKNVTESLKATNQEFDNGNNDEQLPDKEVSKADWFKNPEPPPTPDPDWDKRQKVDFRPPQN
nr:hypothetical protein [Tanacetum cinerariifolium]